MVPAAGVSPWYYDQNQAAVRSDTVGCWVGQAVRSRMPLTAASTPSKRGRYCPAGRTRGAPDRGGPMPHFMIQASYNADAWRRLVQSPEDRRRRDRNAGREGRRSARRSVVQLRRSRHRFHLRRTRRARRRRRVGSRLGRRPHQRHPHHAAADGGGIDGVDAQGGQSWPGSSAYGLTSSPSSAPFPDGEVIRYPRSHRRFAARSHWRGACPLDVGTATLPCSTIRNTDWRAQPTVSANAGTRTMSPC